MDFQHLSNQIFERKQLKGVGFILLSFMMEKACWSGSCSWMCWKLNVWSLTSPKTTKRKRGQAVWHWVLRCPWLQSENLSPNAKINKKEVINKKAYTETRSGIYLYLHFTWIELKRNYGCEETVIPRCPSTGVDFWTIKSITWHKQWAGFMLKSWITAIIGLCFLAERVAEIDFLCFMFLLI